MEIQPIHNNNFSIKPIQSTELSVNVMNELQSLKKEQNIVEDKIVDPSSDKGLVDSKENTIDFLAHLTEKN